MQTIPLGLELELLWEDAHMLKFRLSVSNGQFSGQASFYASLDEANSFATHIAGFPRNRNDIREYEFGGTEMEGYGGAKLHFGCLDGTGHLFVQVSVYSKPKDDDLEMEKATFSIFTLPANVDSFVEDLKQIHLRGAKTAALRHAT